MSRTIWLVMGSTGEYSDHNTWFVCAYEDEATAKRHADAASERAHLFSRGKCGHGETWRDACDDCGRHYCDTELLKARMGDLDPGVTMDYTGTNYVALPVELREAPRG